MWQPSSGKGVPEIEIRDDFRVLKAMDLSIFLALRQQLLTLHAKRPRRRLSGDSITTYPRSTSAMGVRDGYGWVYVEASNDVEVEG